MTNRSAPAFAADVASILIFVAIGRHNHSEGVTPGGVLWTAWPFLAGLALAWIIFRAWRRPTTVYPTGVAVWLSTVAIGMGLRSGIGEGTAVSFVVVATLVTGVLLLGWRAAVRLAARRKA
ncbi:MAG: DUF3054 domain-containing protein, partial [Mycobacterium sp.]|nr:DUF3054 domain-containing protein [Mycobacterium sp.]